MIYKRTDEECIRCNHKSCDEKDVKSVEVITHEIDASLNSESKRLSLEYYCKKHLPKDLSVPIQRFFINGNEHEQEKYFAHQKAWREKILGKG